MLTFKQWLTKKDQLKNEQQAIIKTEQKSDKLIEKQLINNIVKNAKSRKPTSEGKEVLRKMTMQKLRESLSDYVDQVVPSKLS